MPTPTLKSMAKKSKKSTGDLERYWKQGKKAAEKKGVDNKYAYATAITKKRAGIKDSLFKSIKIVNESADPRDQKNNDFGILKQYKRTKKENVGAQADKFNQIMSTIAQVVAKEVADGTDFNIAMAIQRNVDTENLPTLMSDDIQKIAKKVVAEYRVFRNRGFNEDRSTNCRIDKLIDSALSEL